MPPSGSSWPHGPFYAFTTKVDGKTQTLQLRPGPELMKLQEQVAAYREFRQLCEELVVLSEKICQARPAEQQSPEETLTDLHADLRHVAAAAEIDFEAAVRVDPQNHLGWYNRGYGRAIDRNLDGAIADFGESIEANCVHGSDAPETAAFEIGYLFAGIEVVEFGQFIAVINVYYHRRTMEPGLRP